MQKMRHKNFAKIPKTLHKNFVQPELHQNFQKFVQKKTSAHSFSTTGSHWPGQGYPNPVQKKIAAQLLHEKKSLGGGHPIFVFVFLKKKGAHFIMEIPL